MSRPFVDITGQRFGRLTALSYAGQGTTRPDRLWLCKCDCGETTTASTASQKLPRSLGTSRRPFVSPVKRAMRSAIVVGNKGQDALTHLLDGDPTGSGQQAEH